MTVMLDVTTLAFRLINAVVSDNHGVIFIGFPAKGKDSDPAIKIPQLVKAPNVPDHVFTRKFVISSVGKCNHRTVYQDERIDYHRIDIPCFVSFKPEK